MKARKKGFVIPARTEILGGGFVLILLATVALMRGGPQITRAEEPRPRYVPVEYKANAQQTNNANSQRNAQPQNATNNDAFSTPSELPGQLPPKPLTDS